MEYYTEVFPGITLYFTPTGNIGISSGDKGFVIPESVREQIVASMVRYCARMAKERDSAGPKGVKPPSPG